MQAVVSDLMQYRLLYTFFITLLLIPIFSFGAEQLTPVSLQLIWKHQFQSAGYYMAIHKGFYRDAGLDLTISEYSDNIDPVEEVLSQRFDFAIGRSTILAQKAKGADIVALLATYQNSPLMILTSEASGITQPKELRNKRIMMTPGAEKQVELLAMLLQSGITQTDFTRQKHNFNVQSLIKGDTDAMASYISNEPYQLEQLGVGYNIIHPKDFGFSMYSDMLFTSGAYLKQNPERVAAFRQASIRGWHYAFEHIEETADIIRQHYNSQNKTREALIYEGQTLKKLAFANGRFGTISSEKINLMLQLYLLFNRIDADYNFDNFIYKFQQNEQLNLSPEEQAFIATANSFNLCGYPLWEPYSQLNFNHYEGMIPDYLKLIQERTGLSFKTVTTPIWDRTLEGMKAAECDLIAGAMRTPKRSLYLDFTRPYLSMPAVVAVSSDYSDDLSIEVLLQQPVALIQSSAFEEIITNRYPDTRLVIVSSVEQGLKKIQQGQVIAMLDTADTISAAIGRFNLTGLKIVNPGYHNWDISVAVDKQWSDTPFLNILDKAVSSISPQDKEQIRSRWVRVQYEQSIDSTLLWEIFAALAIISLFFAYRYNIIHRHNKELTKLARHDQLTGLYNRRMLNQSLADSVAIAERYNRPLSLIFFDIDDFKLVNDRYGHKAGDEVLIQIAELLHINCRISDSFGRWGGEEFLIILPESPLNSAEKSAEKLRLSIAQHQFQTEAVIQLTSSFGIAEYQPGESMDSFVNRVDQALYRAKSAGKNCVCKDEPPSQPSE
ncbi:diguanylate cyclase [Amphritea sp. HPY]|uniref:diguanylate cyclase n=1 Tax=Amphritea sp. HPY TaxID=3421652 RepID=UPI003D7DA114